MLISDSLLWYGGTPCQARPMVMESKGLLVTYSLVYVGENDYLALFYSRSEYLSL